MKYDFFIASRWRNKKQVIELAKSIRQKGRFVYCFVEGDGSNYELKDLEEKYAPEEFMKHFESIPNWTKNPAVREIFDVDMKALKESENILLLLPAGKSAHLEAGVGYGLGKKCIVIGEQKETESLYLIFSEFYKSVDEFIAHL